MPTIYGMPVYSILFLIGFLNALYLNGANLSLYLTECGFEKDLIGLFCLLGFPFSLKILWSCVIDYVRLPFFPDTPRKAWFFVALVGIALCFLALSWIDPKVYPWLFALALVALSLFSGCFYMVGIAYELESIPTGSYSLGSSCLITGYRTGLLYAGAGFLYLAHIASWNFAFQISATIVIIAGLLMLLVKEPYRSKETLSIRNRRLSEHPTLFKGLVYETLVQPCRIFLQSNNWLVLLATILLFKTADHMAKPMEGPFYLELGFDKQDLALAAKSFGFAATIFGAFFAGKVIQNKNPYYAVALLSIVHTLAEFGCLVHSVVGKSYPLLYLTSGVGNFTGGMLITAFISLLWKTCDRNYAPVQYAFLWSISSLATNLMACCGGFLAASTNWTQFFTTICLIGIATSCLLMAVVVRTKSLDLTPEFRR